MKPEASADNNVIAYWPAWRPLRRWHILQQYVGVGMKHMRSMSSLLASSEVGGGHGIYNQGGGSGAGRRAVACS